VRLEGLGELKKKCNFLNTQPDRDLQLCAELHDCLVNKSEADKWLFVMVSPVFFLWDGF
jgi:hypothetical protein